MTGDSHNVRLSGEGRVGEVASSHKLHYPKKFAEFNSALTKERWSDAQKAEIFRPYLAEKLEHRYCTCLKISSSICSVNLPSENATTLLTGISFILSRYEFWRHPMVGNLRINGDRLWSGIMETARFGATPNGGINRLTLTKEDAAVRHWFKEQTETLGCKVIVDEVGNMFAIRPGKRSGIDPIAMGSHLDTQPTGGKFDGVLGVLGGLEALRTIVESGIETNAPIAVVNWTNEEGSRFR
jgi:hypothetical protein